MSIKNEAFDAVQMRLGTVIGKTIELGNGMLQPYVKASLVSLNSTGGDIGNGVQSARANVDGNSVEVGAGVIYQLGANSQLYLDYEASFGNKYSKPIGVTLGLRHQF